MKRQISLQSPTARSRDSKKPNALRALFLREFIRAVISQVPEKPEWFEDMFLVKLPAKQVPQAPAVILPPKRITNIVITPPVVKLQPKHFSVKPKVIEQKIIAKTEANHLIKPIAPPKSLVPQSSDNVLLPKTGSKILQFLHDPAIIGIECPGPDKNILVNRLGTILPASLSLTPTEIQAILNEVSEATRIPIISGVFKALYKSLLITAVISDFTGTRFIIEKRPMQAMPPVTPIRV
jgi:hypothetical protein